MDRIIKATKYTWRGLSATARTEAAFRQEIVLFVLAVPAAILIAPEFWKRAELLGAVVLVMIVELLNTAIEKLCNRLTIGHDGQIGAVKDTASAAVGMTIMLTAAFWLMAAMEKFQAL
jgi:diacylglycerol kinase (ATP)